MANLTRSPHASLEPTSAIQAGNRLPHLPGNPLRAGEEIPGACMPLRIDAGTNEVVLAAGNTVASANIIGYSAKAYVEGEPVTVYRENTVFRFSDDFAAEGISPGDDLYLGSVGELADAGLANSGDPVAHVLDNHHIVIVRAA